jgi:hypothetical protein
MNNLIANLELSGQKHELRALYKEIAGRFERPHAQLPPDMPENVTIQFGNVDPVQISLVDGKAMITIKIKELSSGRRRWKNFQVIAVYQPRVEGIQADLAREGSLQISGKRLRLGDRIALSGIFNKVFSREHPLSLLNAKMVKDPRLKDLKITLFEMVDGWLAIALSGPPNKQVLLGTRSNPLR